MQLTYLNLRGNNFSNACRDASPVDDEISKAPWHGIVIGGNIPTVPFEQQSCNSYTNRIRKVYPHALL